MAEMKILKCPNCNAALEIENGLDTFYCKYCGNAKPREIKAKSGRM